MILIPVELLSKLFLDISNRRSGGSITIGNTALDTQLSSPLAICTYSIRFNQYNYTICYMSLIDITRFKFIGGQYLYKVNNDEEVSIPQNINLGISNVGYYTIIDTKRVHKEASIFFFIYPWYKITGNPYEQWLVQFLGYREFLLSLIDRKYSSSSLVLENTKLCALLDKQIEEVNQQVEQLLVEYYYQTYRTTHTL